LREESGMKRELSSETGVCQICGKKPGRLNMVPASLVRPVIAAIIRSDHPDWSENGAICLDDLNKYRHEYLRSILEQEKGELSALENGVIESLEKHEILSSHIEDEYESNLSFGEMLSDRLASFGGSWKFLICFACILLIWILINTILIISKAFDPYPFILLNLVLSCLAAIQAPIIMMSQNRQETKDRLRGAHDYQVNLKAELEIRQLHQKIDHLLSSQWRHLVEIQELQLELMEEIHKRGISK
jgi:uncharacterized membrane protein